MTKRYEDGKRRYDVVTAVRTGMGDRPMEHIALLPAFFNGYVYARTYADRYIDLLGNIRDLIKQEEQYLLNRGQSIPVIDEVRDVDASTYLPYDELEERETFSQINVITLYVE